MGWKTLRTDLEHMHAHVLCTVYACIRSNIYIFDICVYICLMFLSPVFSDL